ncbi:unnamed protein product [Chrysodeixis includens]|uniref:Uncharacterized protein n=1 Tax=Chrysodeixis includens TaxID=689277 RepID=A0A9N8PYR4_CHRIL|nr:unnamed protein product [Chrysodeixis includens]
MFRLLLIALVLCASASVGQLVLGNAARFRRQGVANTDVTGLCPPYFIKEGGKCIKGTENVFVPGNGATSTMFRLLLIALVLCASASVGQLVLGNAARFRRQGVANTDVTGLCPPYFIKEGGKCIKGSENVFVPGNGG